MIVNLTPHSVNIHLTNEQVTLPPAAAPARVVLAAPIPAAPVEIDGHQVPVYVTGVTAEVTGLPEPRDGVWLIVSRQVVEARPDRTDLLITHDAVRDDAGRIIGVRGLAKVGGAR